ncbi:AAA family ATPase [Lactobacillus corticis]|uniref:DNA repair ATPase n=1 Tax=Lactobacillus corticis TaxID=2201249 RepID=A0A916QK23_9LACO|nr:AAA family ATPase [Lactobacillus corticis]GFZ26646.1 DNA repair ATPase [Lactobacillus corticis]
MKLKQIKIEHFGQFAQASFDLTDPKLSVFLGANEAGKSTLAAFIKQVMFGFHLKNSASSFFENYEPLDHASPMGGSLIFGSDQGEFELTRLWGKGDPKAGILTVRLNGQEVPETVFFEEIKGIDGDFYADSYMFNQDMLGQVTNLSQKALLEQIYHLGAANSAELLELRDGFAKAAGDAFKKNGRKPPINQMMATAENDREKLAQSEQEFVAYQEKATTQAELNQKLAQVKEQLNQVQTDLTKNQALAKSAQPYARLQTLSQEVKHLDFDPASYEKAQNLMREYRSLMDQINELEGKVKPVKELDEAKIEHVLQKRPELLQWQAQLKTAKQEAVRLDQERSQLLKLNPDLAKLIELNDEELTKLQADYQEAAKAEPQPVEAQKGLYLAALVILVASVALGIAVSPYLFAGIIISVGLGIWQSKQNKQNQRKFDQEQATLKAARQQFTANYGFAAEKADLPHLLDQLRLWRKNELASQQNKDTQKELLNNLSLLASEVAVITGHQVAIAFDAVLSTLNKVEHFLEANRKEQNEQQNLHQQIDAGRERIKTIQLEEQTLFAKAGVKSLAEYQELYQETLRQTKLQTEIDTLRESLRDQLDELSKIKPEELPLKIEQLSKKQAELVSQVEQLRQVVAEKQVELQQLADSKAVFGAKQNLANTISGLADASRQYLADLTAAAWLGRFLDIASNERFPKMIKNAKIYLAKLTGGRYTDLVLERKLTVVRNDGQKLDVEYLSRGTSEQLYFALKLAFIDQLTSDINLPILIDDSFVNFDQTRTKYISDLLVELSTRHQVIIFTAQPALADQLPAPIINLNQEA